MTAKSQLPVPLNDTYIEPTTLKLPWVVVYRLLPEEIALNNCPTAKFGVMNGNGETIAVLESIATAVIELSKRHIAIRSFIFERE